ncbi:MAG TPA: YceI family protein [Candidatus Binataceae bacterium]|nr:YceI family protein [Candidatus Binataceae bacterium]
MESTTIAQWSKRIGAAAISATALFTIGIGSATAATWDLDPAHTNISFSVKHMMLSNVTGSFDKFSGTITANDDDPKSVAIEVTIDASSVDTHNEKRDGHLKSPDFFDVAKYPTITFKSAKIEPDGDNKWKVTGDLTMHGVTKPVTLEVTGPTPEVNVMGAPHRAAEATTTINRQDFGVAFNKTLDNGGLVVGNDVAITINVDAAKK